MIGLIRNATDRRRERGVAMTEFVIVLPVVLLLLLAVAELGRLIISYNTVSKALRDGIRYASAYAILGTSGTVNIDAGLDAEIRNLVVFGDIQGDGSPRLPSFDISQVTVTSPEPFMVQVSADYPYSPFLGITLPTFGLTGPLSLAFDLRASLTMRALG